MSQDVTKFIKGCGDCARRKTGHKAKCIQELYTVCPSDMVLKTAGEPN